MFSYLEAVQKTTAREVYGRGVKYYLEGKVLRHQALTLDFWREYVVLGDEEYKIKFPLIHLALSPEKHDLANKVILENVTCECYYFRDYGVCKHIVAVTASLEQEFNPVTKVAVKTKDKANVDSLLDSIFEAETEKKSRKFLDQFDQYINSSNNYYPFWFDELVREVAKNPVEYKSFLEKLDLKISEALKMFETEVRVVTLIKESLYVGRKFWWEFWSKYFSLLEDYNQSKLYVSLWKMHLTGVFSDFKGEFLEFLRSEDAYKKTEMFELLKKEFPNQTKIWITFAIDSQFTSWLEANLQSLDSENLLKVYDFLPQEQYQIERILLNQVKVWSDFLQPGNYKDIVKTFKLWEEKIGRSEVYEMAITYIKESHGKKKKLLKDLGSFL